MLIYSVLTVLLSSFLLFIIQPIAAKALLPTFGGVPAVWNICLLFFQGMLLFGYAYVHATSKFLSAVNQKILHLLIILFSLLMFPIIWNNLSSATLSPTVNVLWLLSSKLFLPIFVVSSTAPLVQLWFSQSNHAAAQDPYFLYSASNVGSLLALFSFSFLFEPLFGLQQLSAYWFFLYGAFAVTILLTSIHCKPNIATAKIGTTKIGTSKITIPVMKISWRQRAEWMILSFAPSSLLMAVTQYITTEIAAIPLLWIIPLIIYLLCFVIAFARRPFLSPDWMAREQSLFIIFPLLSLSKPTLTLPAWQLIFFHLLGFFALVMVCLGKLLKKRPDHSHLTDFYLWIAIGGLLGGIFTSVIAPIIFNGIYEYYFAFCLCLLLRPWPISWKWSDLKFCLLIFIVLSANYFFVNLYYSIFSQQFVFIKYCDLFVIVAIIVFTLLQDQRPLRYAISIALLFVFAQPLPGFKPTDLVWQARNFFGVTRVYQKDDLHILMNGSTLHGVELLSQPLQYNRLTSYYQPLELIASLLEKNKTNLNVAIAGLGTGVLSCQFRKQDQVTFFEIDPNVMHIAKNSKLFSYLKECPAQIILGDARLQIANTPDHFYDEIIIDVFSSDAIPIHLLTREAVATYLKKLAPNGLLLFNISNQHLNLAPVLFGIAQELHTEMLWRASYHSNIPYQLPSEWVMLTRNSTTSELLTKQDSWKKIVTIKQPILWTDDYSNIVSVLK